MITQADALASVFISIHRTGTLPSAWSSQTNLIDLQLGSNSLRGTLPEQWSGMASLASLDVTGNNIQGGVPTAWSSLRLDVLVCQP